MCASKAKNVMSIRRLFIHENGVWGFINISNIRNAGCWVFNTLPE